jgi:hypothetical protein
MSDFNEHAGVKVTDFLVITDPDTSEVLYNGRGMMTREIVEQIKKDMENNDVGSK